MALLVLILLATEEVIDIDYLLILLTVLEKGYSNMILERFCYLSPVLFPYMSVYSISMYVCSELASIGARARQLETDARKRRNIDCVQDIGVRVLFATFVPNIWWQRSFGLGAWYGL